MAQRLSASPFSISSCNTPPCLTRLRPRRLRVVRPLQVVHKYATTSSNETAPSESSAKSDQTWHDLKWVGSRKYVWENTTPIQSVQRWAPGQAMPLEELESQLLCSLVETLLLYDGQHESDIDMSILPIRQESEFNQLFPDGIAVGRDEQGNPMLEISDADRTKIVHHLTGYEHVSLSTDESPMSGASETTNEAQTASSAVTPWQRTPLKPLSLRFIFLKRLFQRTGHRLSDSNLGACSTIADVYRLLLTQQAQKRTLAQELQDDRKFGLKDFANVALKETRYSKVDRDVSIGRWKLTREALQKAGLPEFFKDPPLSIRRRNTAVLPEQPVDPDEILEESTRPTQDNRW